MSGGKLLTKHDLERAVATSGRYRRRGSVSAKPLSSDLHWSSGHGDDLLSHQGDWLLTDGIQTWAVAGHIFRRRYVRRNDGQFQAKSVVHAFQLCEDAQVMTLEGVVNGVQSDWVLVGEDDDAWVVSAPRFAATYSPVDDDIQ
jgi:hypothetical protein